MHKVNETAFNRSRRLGTLGQLERSRSRSATMFSFASLAYFEAEVFTDWLLFHASLPLLPTSASTLIAGGPASTSSTTTTSQERRIRFASGDWTNGSIAPPNTPTSAISTTSNPQHISWQRVQPEHNALAAPKVKSRPASPCPLSRQLENSTKSDSDGEDSQHTASDDSISSSRRGLRLHRVCARTHMPVDLAEDKVHKRAFMTMWLEQQREIVFRNSEAGRRVKRFLID